MFFQDIERQKMTSELHLKCTTSQQLSIKKYLSKVHVPSIYSISNSEKAN